MFLKYENFAKFSINFWFYRCLNTSFVKTLFQSINKREISNLKEREIIFFLFSPNFHQTLTKNISQV
jgi:hypothetical protein